MRANQECSSTSHSYRLSPKRGKISKSSKAKREQQQTLGQLQQLVPALPLDQKLSKLELLQHVIDYIYELQWKLNQEPSLEEMPAPDLGDLMARFGQIQTGPVVAS